MTTLLSPSAQDFTPPIHVSASDFASITQNGALCDANGDLGPAEFEALLRQQVRLYTQRQVVETLMHGQASAADFVMLETLKIVAMDMGKMHAELRATEGAVRGLQGEVARLGGGRGDAQAGVLQGIREILACLRGRAAATADGGDLVGRALHDVEESRFVSGGCIGMLVDGCGGCEGCEGGDGGGVRNGVAIRPSAAYEGGGALIVSADGGNAGCVRSQCAPSPACRVSAAGPDNEMDEGSARALAGIPGPPQATPLRRSACRMAAAGGGAPVVMSCLGYSAALELQRRGFAVGAHGALVAPWQQSAAGIRPPANRQQQRQGHSLLRQRAAAADDRGDDATDAAYAAEFVGDSRERAQRFQATPPASREDLWPGETGPARGSSWQGNSRAAAPGGEAVRSRGEGLGGTNTKLRRSWGSSCLTETVEETESTEPAADAADAGQETGAAPPVQPGDQPSVEAEGIAATSTEGTASA